jgi:predicted DNA-binding transcriptional regulator AlpA
MPVCYIKGLEITAHGGPIPGKRGRRKMDSPARPKNMATPKFSDLPPMEVVPAILDTAQMRQLLGISVGLLLKLCRQGKLPMPRKIGRTSRWKREEVMDALDRLPREFGESNAWRHNKRAVTATQDPEVGVA